MCPVYGPSSTKVRPYIYAPNSTWVHLARAVVPRQKAVSAYYKSNKILSIGFAEHVMLSCLPSD